MGTLYRCDTGSIKGFPLTVTGPRPTADNYKNSTDTLEGLIDFQWQVLVSGLNVTPETSKSSTGSIIIQKNDTGSTESTVFYNTLRYTLENVQITTSQHSSWLISPPAASGSGSCTEDLVILLKGRPPTSGTDVYMIFVLPILNGGQKDPDYLKNIGGTTSGGGIDSCFSAIPDATFATYVTCFDGYSTHAHTQNIKVFVSTVGMPVTTATMNKIKSDFPSVGRMELPEVVRLSLPAAPAVSGQAPTLEAGSTLTTADFVNKITTTTFSKRMSNVASADNVRHDPTNAYKCVELNPDSLDANGNLQVNLVTGDLNSSTLQDILLERQVLKEMVAPGEATPGTLYNSTAREVAAFLLAFIIVTTVFVGVYSVISADTSAGTTAFGRYRFPIELGLSIIIAILFIVGTGIGLFSKDPAVKTQGGYVVLSAGVTAFLFYLIFMVWIPPVAATSLSLAATGTGLTPVTPSGATPPSTTPKEGSSWVSWFSTSMKSAMGGTWSTTSVAIISTVLGFLGFLFGMLIQ
jgi:hypothetical protein